MALIKRETYSSIKPSQDKVLFRSDNPLAKKCVGYWAFTEGNGKTLHDFSGYKHHGTLTNMDPTTDWVTSPYGIALDFDGLLDNVVANFRFNPTQGMTVTLLIWQRIISGANQAYLASSWAGPAGPTSSWTFFTESATGAFRYYTHDGANTSVLNLSTVIPIDGYYVISLVYDGGTNVGNTHLYIDGVNVENGRTERVPQAISPGCYLGARPDGSRAANAKYVMASLWQRPLSSAEIQELYEQPFALITPPKKYYLASGAVEESSSSSSSSTSTSSTSTSSEGFTSSSSSSSTSTSSTSTSSEGFTSSSSSSSTSTSSTSTSSEGFTSSSSSSSTSTSSTSTSSEGFTSSSSSSSGTIITKYTVIKRETYTSLKPSQDRVLFRHNNPLSKNCLGYWAFTEGHGNIVHDFSGYKKDGIIYGSDIETNWTKNIWNFNGTDNEIELIGTESYNYLPITIACRIRHLTGTADDNDVIINKFRSIDSSGWSLDSLSNNYNAYYFGTEGDTGYGQISLGPVSTDWTDLVFTVDYSFIKAYRNGLLVDSGDWLASTPSMSTSTATIRLGNLAQPGDDHWMAMQMDYAAIWNRALSASEIQELYEQPFSLITPPKKYYLVSGAVEESSSSSSSSTSTSSTSTSSTSTSSTSTSSTSTSSEGFTSSSSSSSTSSEGITSSSSSSSTSSSSTSTSSEGFTSSSSSSTSSTSTSSEGFTSSSSSSTSSTSTSSEGFTSSSSSSSTSSSSTSTSSEGFTSSSSSSNSSSSSTSSEGFTSSSSSSSGDEGIICNLFEWQFLTLQGRLYNVFEAKRLTDNWIPIRLVDETDKFTPETGVLFGDITVKYGYESATAESTYTFTSADWKEQGDGNYWLRIGAAEFLLEGKYEVKVESSGCSDYNCIIQSRSLTVSEIGLIIQAT